jgi:hypothetical protein
MDIINILDASEKAIATLMLEVNRLNNEIKLKDEQLEALKKELTLQKLSDIGQEIEDRDSAIYATGYWKGIEYKRMRELTDDEIKDEWFDINKSALSRIEVDMQLIFARAILKKASEK